MPDRWVRFHSLPHAKRYPSTADEYREVLVRYNAVLNELRCAAVYLVTPAYDSGDSAAGTEPIHVGLHPGAVFWTHAVDPAGPEVSYDLHVTREDLTPGRLDGLLRYVADGRACEVVITDTELRWLFAPYDGGMDVIASSAAERDRLAARFHTWLSDRPDGL